VTDAKGRDKWEKDGSQDAFARAKEIAKKILARDEKSYIPEEVDQAIRKKYDIRHHGIKHKYVNTLDICFS
jgi:trimethylamine:corrinoid methyltransferase-like protein